MSIRIGVPRHVVRVRKARKVYTVFGGAQVAANRAIVAAIESAASN